MGLLEDIIARTRAQDTFPHFLRADAIRDIVALPDNIQVVDSVKGNDNYSGEAPGAARKSIHAAIAALPDGGIVIPIPRPSGGAFEYPIEQSVPLDGHAIVAPFRQPGGTESIALLRHRFDGDMFTCVGAKGFALKNLNLYQDDAVARPGRVVNAASTATEICGDILLENLLISGGGGWERNFLFDGSAFAGSGIRKVKMLFCQIFGAVNAAENTILRRAVHFYALGCHWDQAPAGPWQTIRVEDSGSTDVQFQQCELIGNFYSEAAGSLVWDGVMTGDTLQLSASALYNTFRGRLPATIIDPNFASPTAGNLFIKTPTPHLHLTLTGDQELITGGAQRTITPWTMLQDTDGMWNAGLPDRGTVKTPGLYAVVLRGAMTQGTAGYRAMKILRNGSLAGQDPKIRPGAIECAFTVPYKIRANAGDFIQAATSHDDPASLFLKDWGDNSYSCNMTITKVG